MTISIPQPQPFNSLLSLAGRCAVVTGGSRGLGEAIVRRLVEAGAAVVFTGRGLEALQRVEADILATGGKVVGVQADISRLEDSQKVINLAVERFGHIDILVNNAAAFPGSQAMDMTEAVWDETFDTDAKGAFFAAQFAARAMIAAGRGGRIINLLSTAAFRVASPLIAYGAAKAGLWYVTQAMSQELAEHHILVNAVTPGATMTAERIAALNEGRLVEHVLGDNPMSSFKQAETLLKNNDFADLLAKATPLGRPGYPDDIANAVLFLASDMATYISGINITVDGGQSLNTMGFGGNQDAEPASTTASDQSSGVLDKSLAGIYKATVKAPIGSQEVVFTYRVEGAALTGTVKFAGMTADIENGRATQNGFVHQFRIKSPMGKATINVEGKLDGDKLVGILKSPMGSMPFEAKRV